jgi:hypothetical protein
MIRVLYISEWPLHTLKVSPRTRKKHLLIITVNTRDIGVGAKLCYFSFEAFTRCLSS